MRRLIALLILLPCLAAAQMVTRDGIRLDTRQEQRAEAIGAELRCLVCQNESIEDSSAGLARQLRVIIRQQVVAGVASRSILDYMVRRYGIFVLLKPPLSRLTLLLYASPFLALLGGVLTVWLARRRPLAAGDALSDAEQARLSELLER